MQQFNNNYISVATQKGLRLDLIARPTGVTISIMGLSLTLDPQFIRLLASWASNIQTQMDRYNADPDGNPAASNPASPRGR